MVERCGRVGPSRLFTAPSINEFDLDLSATSLRRSKLVTLSDRNLERPGVNNGKPHWEEAALVVNEQVGEIYEKGRVFGVWINISRALASTNPRTG